MNSSGERSGIGIGPRLPVRALRFGAARGNRRADSGSTQHIHGTIVDLCLRVGAELGYRIFYTPFVTLHQDGLRCWSNGSRPTPLKRVRPTYGNVFHTATPVPQPTGKP
jgi:hypothetical protein